MRVGIFHVGRLVEGIQTRHDSQSSALCVADDIATVRHHLIHVRPARWVDCGVMLLRAGTCGDGDGGGGFSMW